MEFDYKAARERYMTLVNEKMQDKYNKKFYGMYTQEEIKKLMPVENHNEDGFHVAIKDGKKILVMRRNKLDNKGTSVLSFEDIFDIFMKLHVSHNHASKEELVHIAKTERYMLPVFCLEILISVCDVCNSNIKEQSKGNTTAAVYVISIMRKRVDQKFGYLLIYEDKATNFILLRPMLQKSGKEIAITLFQIFTQSGPPGTLYFHGYNPDLTKDIDGILKKLCPMFIINVKHKNMAFELPTLITDMLDKWRETAQSDYWEIGCSSVQVELNKSALRSPANNKKGVPPFNLYLPNKNKENVEYVTYANQAKDTSDLRPKPVKESNVMETIVLSP